MVSLVGSIAHEGDVNKFYSILYEENYRSVPLGGEVDLTSFDFNSYKEKPRIDGMTLKLNM